MRIVILTNETTHHAYFVREMAKHARVAWVALETQSVIPPFETVHPYEAHRDQHERAAWFDGASPGVGEFAEASRISSVNDLAVVHRLKDTPPDAVFVFGTSRLRIETINACGANVLNLHGGDPLKYRGLDSHLWAIYHRDFKSIVTVLHEVSPELDRGNIIERQSLPIMRNMQLHELRRVNTEMCIQLCRNALAKLDTKGVLRSTPQAELGRYYSHMPSVLKSLCVDRFAAYTRSLA